MSTDNLRLIAYGLYILAAVFAVAAAFFFWKLRIPDVIADLNGKSARREIAARRQEREKKKKTATPVKEKPDKDYRKFASQAPGEQALPEDQSDTAPLDWNQQDEAGNETVQLTELQYDDGSLDDECDTVPLSDAERQPGFVEEAGLTETLTSPDGSMREDDTDSTAAVTAAAAGPGSADISDESLYDFDEDDIQTTPLEDEPEPLEDEPTTPLSARIPQTESVEFEDILDTSELTDSQTHDLVTENYHSADTEDETQLLTTNLNQRSAAQPAAQSVRKPVNPRFIMGERVMIIHTDQEIPVESY